MILGKTKARKLTKQVKKLVKKHGGDVVGAYVDSIISDISTKQARVHQDAPPTTAAGPRKKTKKPKTAKITASA